MDKRIHMLGCYIDALTMDETIEKIKQIIKSKKYTQHVVINASKAVLMQKDKKLTEIINNCELINADGQSIVWASKLLGKPLPERVTGIDLFNNLVKEAAKEGYRIYFFGAKEEVVKRVVEIYKEKYPNLNIAGYRNGYFKEDESLQIAEQIRNSRPDILFVAFSSPKKEYWINEYLKIMKVPFVMGVGGSFDVVAGVTKRAPKWMQNLGLEWFYRFIQEPRRMWRRYIIGNFKFVKLVLKSKFR
ncbi:WecB/TagA/CpsF family glycosyltransferase [Clostridium prolinivorans]|uniref:WecB/TagA/CpsF family glycosyltransferase n=1 Tax=Clostridium prolinivorans TaxID=2769420 RepID=UPI000FD82C79|nr:WecB/TagA/CpsF family glycosyltransferase [Clostridium prolinivorans]